MGVVLWFCVVPSVRKYENAGNVEKLYYEITARYGKNEPMYIKIYIYIYIYLHIRVFKRHLQLKRKTSTRSNHRSNEQPNPPTNKQKVKTCYNKSPEKKPPTKSLSTKIDHPLNLLGLDNAFCREVVSTKWLKDKSYHWGLPKHWFTVETMKIPFIKMRSWLPTVNLRISATPNVSINQTIN